MTASNATSYQWQVDSGMGFTNVSNSSPYSNSTTATLTITGATAGMNGYRYRAVAIGGATPNATSNSALLTVNNPPDITTQPSTASVCTGSNASFTVAASNATSYQWQVNKGAGYIDVSNGAPYSGATTATLAITSTTAALNGYIYRAVASGLAEPSATSNGAALTVYNAPGVTTHPSGKSVLAGSDATFTASMSNASSYQWQESQNGGTSYNNVLNGTSYSGATTQTLTVKSANAAKNGYMYRLVASGACSPIAMSNGAALTVISPPTVDSVTPASGTTAGGHSVIIAGAHFSTTKANNIVKFGTGSATVTAATATQLTVTTPSGSAGTVNVSVEVGGQTGALSNAYTYVLPAVANAVASTVAANSTNNAITLNITGGTAGSVGIETAPTHGTATATGTAITYTPATGYVGPDSFKYTAINGAGTSVAATVTITVSPPTVALTPASGALADGAIAAAYNAAFTAAGGTTPYNYAVTSGALPGGLVLAANGTLSGIPTEDGAFNFTVTATDSSTGTGPVTTAQNYSLTIATPTIVVSPATLANATVGAAYSENIVASGGTSAYSYTITAGTLPAGLVLAGDGTLSGTPTQDGTFNFTVTATDSSTGTGPHTGSLSYVLSVGAPTIVVSPATLANATVGAAYSENVVASGGTSAYSYAITAGTLPAGLVLAGDGTLSGTPTEDGTFNFTVTATDSSTGTGPYTGSLSYVLSVGAPTIVVSPATLANATVGAAYSENVVASGGTSAYSYAITAGTLPAGLVLAGDGTLSGTPTQDGTFNFTVTATDSSTGTGPYTGARAYAFTVDVPVISVAPAAGALPDGTTGATYSQSITASGGTSPYSYAVTSGTLPTGLTLSSTGLFDGAPTTTGSSSFTVTATDAYGSTGSATYTLAVSHPTVSMTPAAGALPDGTTGATYSQSITASGGTSPYSYAVTSGTLPAGLTLSSTGLFDGAPTTTGSSSFTVTATDAYGATTANAYTLAVNHPTVSMTPAAGALPDGTTGTTYSQSITASGGTSPYSYAVTSGTLPAGLTLSSTGLFDGAPTTTGSSSFTVTATDAYGATGTAMYTLAIVPALLPPVAQAVSASVAAESASTAISLALGGGTASSVAVDTPPRNGTAIASGMMITYQPAAEYSGTDSFTYTATNAAGTSTPATVTVTVVAAPFTFTPASGSLGETMAGEDYSQSIVAKGGKAPMLYSLASGTLPKGMVLNISTGELTGPLDGESEGDYTFAIEARDGNGATTVAAYTLKVTPRKVTVTDKVVAVPPGSTPADVYLNREATGGPFTSAEMTFVEPANAGTATIIRGQVAQAGPASQPIGWYLQFTPNSGFSGTARVGFRLTSALGLSNTGTVTYSLGLNASQVADEVDTLVRGFVDTRQNLITSHIHVPGLLERRRMEQATEAMTARLSPSEEGMTISASTSLAQMKAARDNADGVIEANSDPFNVWLDIALLAHSRDQNNGRWGSFAMLNLGADYLLSERALVGLSFHYDHMTDPTDADAALTGNGWLAGPYASFEIGKGIFWDTSLLYGGSVNDIDTAFWDGTFDTARWMIDTAIKGQWTIDEATILTPQLRVVYFNETVDDYTVHNDAGDTVIIDGFNAEQFRVSLGAEIERSFALENGSTLTPKLGVTTGYSGLDGSGVFGSLKAGLSFETDDFWMLDAGLLFNIDGDGGKSVGGKVSAVKRF